MRATGIGGIALAAVAALPLGAAAAGPWSFGGQLGAAYDDNAGNAGSAADRREVTRVSAGVDATYTRRFGLFSALELRGSLDGEDSLSLHELSYGRVAARLRFLHKPGEGFFVPILAADVSVGHRDYGSGLRDSDDYRAGAWLLEPLTTKVQARAGFTWADRDARSRVFDGQTRSYEAGLDWRAAPRLTLYGSYRLDEGPVVVSAQGVQTPKTEHLYLYPAAQAVEPDPAFGWDWYAYRLVGHTGLATLGANVPLGADVALDAQLVSARSVATGPSAYGGEGRFAYTRWLGALSLLMRF